MLAAAFSFYEPGKGHHAETARGLAAGAIIGEAANYTRLLACKPGNVIHPQSLVAEALDFARREKLKATIIDEKKAAALGMGGLVSVGKGSNSPPVLIVLEYTGPGAAKRKSVAIVGKAVTFDTGGISIKPAADMDAMKYDKCGGMAVLGILQAAARLRLPMRVVGVIPTAENSVSSNAYRPGDIVRFYNGKTAEITNTDAEGRLILADALAYVADKYDPAAIIDLATLTGGVVVALGSVYAGLFANDDPLAAALEKAGEASGELLWRLPLHERYKPLMEGYHADLVNSGLRGASGAGRDFSAALCAEGNSVGAFGYCGDGLSGEGRSVSGEGCDGVWGEGGGGVSPGDGEAMKAEPKLGGTSCVLGCL